MAWVHNSSVYPVVSKTPGYTPECGIAFLHCHCCHLATASTACVFLYMHTFVHECVIVLIIFITVATQRFLFIALRLTVLLLTEPLGINNN